MHGLWRTLWLFLIPAVTALGTDSSLYHVGNRSLPPSRDPYLERIQPILSSRCVACHGCYEAPCQLNLESYEGLRRGYNPIPLYASTRLAEVKPTRLIDAKSVPEWRAKGFYPVVTEDGSDFRMSLLTQLLEQGTQKNVPGFKLMELMKVQEDWLDNSKAQCLATAKDWNERFRFPQHNPFGVKYIGHFLTEHPLAGMPFGLPRLSETDYRTLTGWIESGARGPERAAAEELAAPSHPEVIAAWEEFLNGDSTKAQQTARYIYEHVFTAHLYFEENPGEYFELVRSRTRAGAIDQIVTQLPYDYPGVNRVYYRLKKITRAIAQKTHFVWRLNRARLAHLEALFLRSDWGRGPVPAPVYGSPNPFKNFASIPAAIRSRFLIENAKVIVGGMTQGSVCVGSTATYAISDHFWAWFLKPESDVSVQDPSLGLKDIDVLATAPIDWKPHTTTEWWLVSRLDRLSGDDIDRAASLVSKLNKLTGVTPDPGATTQAVQMMVAMKKYGMKGDEILAAVVHFFRTTSANHMYQEAYERQLRKFLRRQGRDSLLISDLWTGDGDSSYPNGNPNAWLSITRHGRSATVQYGEEGGTPQSIWVMSYSNFERLYYNLVASFKEWGSVAHKAATWRHMSYVRLEGEDLAISFLPLEQRAEVRERFARGMAGFKNKLFFPLYSAQGMSEGTHYNPLYYLPGAKWDLPPRPSPYRYGNADETIHYVVSMVRNRLAKVASTPTDDGLSAGRLSFEKRLLALAGKNEAAHKVHYAKVLPDITYVRVTGPGEPWIYSLIVDRGYKGHNEMLAEQAMRDPQYDSLSVYRGLVGYYPNLFLDVPAPKLDAFLEDLSRLSRDADRMGFEKRWGIARNSPRFWPFFDWLHAFKAHPSPGVDPIEQGIVDLSQYDLFEE